MKKNATLMLFGFLIIIILFVLMEFRPEIYMPLERFLYDKREFFEIDLTQERTEIALKSLADTIIGQDTTSEKQ